MPGTHFSVEVRPILPQRLSRLNELANDLYYTWGGRGVRILFRLLDAETWESCHHNPKVFLRRVPQRKLDAAVRDPILLAEYRRVLSAYDTSLEDRPSSQIDKYLDLEQDLVAYFSAEYGFHESVPIYAGGLGILAADYCKAMSKLWVPFVGVGLLYHTGYFTQRILNGGEQVADYPYIDAANLPVTPALAANGEEVHVRVDLPSGEVKLRVWEAKAGHLKLYLLDSDLPTNALKDRSITYQLYGGDANTRVQQEIVLGIGGVRALRALGLKPTVWHINEGHAAFLVLERCLEYVSQGMDFDTALELVAANTVFTTHTPVPAGHDIFDFPLMGAYFAGLMARLGISESRFLALGANPRNPYGFNMTALALRGSRFHNGVSRIHGGVAAQMEAYVWPQVPAEENPIGYTTNGTDVETFLGHAWVALFDMYMGGGWRARLTDKNFWQEFIDGIPNHVYLSTRQVLKAEMLEDACRRAKIQYRRAGYPDSVVGHITRFLTPHNLNTLVVGFARRFATYKRATLLFRDLDRLARLVDDPQRPVLFIFAGKAHPDDHPGQQLLKDIYQISMRPEFQGKIIVLEDYSLDMARRLMPGVDVWLNVPEYPKEACGTSGMKAAINGAVNLSVLDGWWGEAYDGENGWAITPHPELDPQTRDWQESIELLSILEHQVIPLFYDRNAQGEPDAWARKSRASMKSILPRFNSIRMAMDYLQAYYGPAKTQGTLLMQDQAAGAKALARWKKKIAEGWPGVRIRLAEPPPKAVNTGEPLPITVAVYLNGLAPEDVIAECVLGKETELLDFLPTEAVQFTPIGGGAQGETLFHGNLCSPELCLLTGGLEHYKIRVFPYHPLLSHRFECGCMLWL